MRFFHRAPSALVIVGLRSSEKEQLNVLGYPGPGKLPPASRWRHFY